MKKLLLSILLAAATAFCFAQDLVPDQNPNYKQSMDKYAASQQTLQATMNTTVQSTYKAYDWSTARADRKKENRDFRRQRQLYGIYNNNDYYDDDYGYRYNNGYNNYRYNNGYNNGYNNNYNYNRRYNRNRCYFWFW
jgi:hypothetical protein